MRFFDRHIISWYAGVLAQQVADAERCHVGDVRRARARAGRGTELGLQADDHHERASRLQAGHQLSLAELTVLQRTPPERT